MTQKVCIIDYGSGNLRSVEKAFERAASGLGGGFEISVTDKADTIADADRVVLPGVGAFAACADGLRARPGVIEALEHAALVNARPFLGICVGMQLLADCGVEYGVHDGLEWIAGRVDRIEPGDPAITVPHMGWSSVTAEGHGALPEAINDQAFYFAHSYHFAPKNAAHALAYTHHGVDLVAAVMRDNILGAQFHPEKSQSAGIGFLRAFLQWSPT